MQISTLLDQFLPVDLPVLVTAAGVPSRPLDGHGGSWHGTWSDKVQAKWSSRLFAVALSKPFIESLIWADLCDHDDAELPGAGLITTDGKSKSVLQRLVGMRKHLRKPLGLLRSSILSPTPTK